MRNFINIYRFFITVLLTVMASSYAFAGPKFELDATTISIGKVFVHEQKKNEIVIKNTGDAVLQIIRIDEDCECTTVETDKKTLAPGESGKIIITFEAGEEIGETVEEAKIFTNDPDKKETDIHVNAVVIPFAEIHPPRLDFGKIKPGKNVQLSSMLVPTQESGGIEISDIKNRHPFFKTMYDSGSAIPNGSITITVLLSGKAIFGTLKDTVRIEFSKPVKTWLEIPVSAVVQGNINVYPEKIFLGRLKNGSSQKKSFLVDSASSKTLTINVVSCDLPEKIKTNFSIKELDKGRKFEISFDAAISADYSDSNGLKTGNIIINTNIDEQKEVLVPVSFLYTNDK